MTTTEQQTVEEALKEALEIFRGKWVTFDFAEDHTIDPRGKRHKDSRYMIQAVSSSSTLVYQSEAETLSGLMAQVRQWYAEQGKES